MKRFLFRPSDIYRHIAQPYLGGQVESFTLPLYTLLGPVSSAHSTTAGPVRAFADSRAKVPKKKENSTPACTGLHQEGWRPARISVDGGEPASAAPGGGRPSPSFALFRPRIEMLRWQDAKLQGLRPALCLSRRPAEGECRLPLDSGRNHPGLSSTGCALSIQVESSLYKKCGVLLGAGSWRLADRYL